MKSLLRPKLIFSLVTGGLLASALAVSLLFGSPGRSHAASHNSPEGSWLVNVTITSRHPAFKFQALFTYDAGGGLVETDQTDFTIPTGLTSPAHGTWISTGEEHFASTFVEFIFDAKGKPAGTVKIREVDTLSEGGDAYSGSGKFDVFDVNGKLILSGTDTEQARRIQVEGV